ncbi:plasma membrane heat shock protein [Rhodotorula sphaerocarpa]
MDVFERRYTSSLQVDPVRATIGLSAPGSNYAWALFGVFVIAALLLAAAAHSRPKGMRAFHYLGMAVLVTTTISYAGLAANLSYTPVPVEFVRSGSRGAAQIAGGAQVPPTRSIFYGRYIDWIIVTPLLLLTLLLNTGFTLSRIFIILYFQIVMIACGLIGALIPTRYKWAFYAFGCASLFYILWNVIFPGRKSAYRLGDDVGRTYTGHTLALGFLFTLYPLCWALCEGGNVLTVTSEFIWYGVLDLLVKVFWLFSFLFSIEDVPYDIYGFRSSKVTDVAPSSERGREESPREDVGDKRSAAERGDDGGS